MRFRVAISPDPCLSLPLWRYAQPVSVYFSACVRVFGYSVRQKGKSKQILGNSPFFAIIYVKAWEYKNVKSDLFSQDHLIQFNLNNIKAVKLRKKHQRVKLERLRMTFGTMGQRKLQYALHDICNTFLLGTSQLAQTCRLYISYLTYLTVPEFV